MFTVKEVLTLLRDAEKIYISWNGNTRQIDRDCSLDREMYGDYIVSKIGPGYESESFEIELLAEPVKRGARA